MSSLSVLLLTLLATGIYAGVCAGEDAYQIARNYNVSHLWQGRQRGTTLAGFALLAYAYRLFSPCRIGGLTWCRWPRSGRLYACSASCLICG
jgi:hypothetical protein